MPSRAKRGSFQKIQLHKTIIFGIVNLMHWGKVKGVYDIGLESRPNSGREGCAPPTRSAEENTTISILKNAQNIIFGIVNLTHMHAAIETHRKLTWQGGGGIPQQPPLGSTTLPWPLCMILPVLVCQCNIPGIWLL